MSAPKYIDYPVELVNGIFKVFVHNNDYWPLYAVPSLPGFVCYLDILEKPCPLCREKPNGGPSLRPSFVRFWAEEVEL